MQYSEQTKEAVAKIIDKSSYVTLKRVGRHYTPFVRIRRRRREILEEIKKFFDGHISEYQDSAGRSTYCLTMTGKKAITLMHSAYGYLQKKGDHARIFLKFADEMRKWRAKTRVKGEHMTYWEQLARTELYNEMKRINNPVKPTL